MIANRIVIDSGLIEYLKKNQFEVIIGVGETFRIGKPKNNFKNWHLIKHTPAWLTVRNKIVDMIHTIDGHLDVFDVLERTTLFNKMKYDGILFESIGIVNDRFVSVHETLPIVDKSKMILADGTPAYPELRGVE